MEALIYTGDDDAYDDEIEVKGGKKSRKSAIGRRLMRWNPGVDQLVLLSVDYVCAKQGIAVPWDDVAKLVEPFLTGEAVKQHLTKVRKYREESGHKVPPKLDTKARRRIGMGKYTTPVTPARDDNAAEEEDAPMKGSSLLFSAQTKKTPGSRKKAKIDSGTEEADGSFSTPAKSSVKRARKKQQVTVENEGDGDISQSDHGTSSKKKQKTIGLRALASVNYAEHPQSDDDDTLDVKQEDDEEDEEFTESPEMASMKQEQVYFGENSAGPFPASQFAMLAPPRMNLIVHSPAGQDFSAGTGHSNTVATSSSMGRMSHSLDPPTSANPLFFANDYGHGMACLPPLPMMQQDVFSRDLWSPSVPQFRNMHGLPQGIYPNSDSHTMLSAPYGGAAFGGNVHTTGTPFVDQKALVAVQEQPINDEIAVAPFKSNACPKTPCQDAGRKNKKTPKTLAGKQFVEEIDGGVDTEGWNGTQYSSFHPLNGNGNKVVGEIPIMNATGVGNQFFSADSPHASHMLNGMDFDFSAIVSDGATPTNTIPSSNSSYGAHTSDQMECNPSACVDPTIITPMLNRVAIHGHARPNGPNPLREATTPSSSFNSSVQGSQTMEAVPNVDTGTQFADLAASYDQDGFNPLAYEQTMPDDEFHSLLGMDEIWQ